MNAEHFARATIEALSAHVCVLDENGTIVVVNRAWLDFAFANSAEPSNVAEGVNYLTLCDSTTGEGAEVAASIAVAIRNIIDGGTQPFSIEYPCHSPTQKRWFTARVTNFPGGGRARVVIAHENITERKRAEEALLASEEKYRTLVETADDAIVLTDMDGRPLFRNSAYYTSLGYSPGENISIDGYSNVHPDDLARVKNISSELIERGSVAIEYRVRHKDGHWVCRFAKSTVIYDDLQKPKALLAIIRDVTEQKQAEEARIQLIDQLRLNREELRTLSRRMVEIQEQERREIARELHDEIGQSLTGLKLLLHVSVDMPTEKILANIDQAQKTIAELVARVRDVSLDLRPAMLDDLGLLPTLLWYLERYTTQTRVNINFRHIGLEGKRFSSSIETAAFRIIQEALTNIARHALVKEANVRVWAHTDTLLVQIQDMGKGFDAASALASGQSSGLTGMRERAMLLGGTMMIDSAPKNGTRLTAEIPLSGRMERRLNDRVHFAGR